MTYPPAMFRRKDAAAYVSLTVAQFESAIADGVLPLPTRDLAGVELWSRRQLDKAIDALEGGQNWRDDLGKSKAA